MSPAKWIIINPYLLSELSSEDEFEEVYSYMGLRVAVSNHPLLDDFELA